jgi:hypothetical protein
MAFNYNPDAQHWDGYRDQIVLMMDEYSMTHPSLATAQNMQSMVIKCKNTFPFLLNMASLDAKGNTFFRGKLMVATSNIKDPLEDARQFVACPEAVTNRIDFDCVVVVKKEFATDDTVHLPPRQRNLDTNKIPKTDSGFYWYLHDFEIEKRTVINDQVTVTVTHVDNVDTLIEMIIERYRKYEREAESDRRAVQEAIDRGITQAQGLDNDILEYSRFVADIHETPLDQYMRASSQFCNEPWCGGESLHDMIWYWRDPESARLLEMLPERDRFALTSC